MSPAVGSWVDFFLVTEEDDSVLLFWRLWRVMEEDDDEVFCSRIMEDVDKEVFFGVYGMY